MESAHVRWDLPFNFRSSDRTFSFNEVLNKLRCLYEEVCAQNAELKLQAVAADRHSPSEMKIEDRITVPRECSPACGPPGLRLAGVTHHQRLRTPRTPGRLSPPTAGDDADLRKIIDNMSRQQRYISEQISEAVILGKAQASTSVATSPKYVSKIASGGSQRGVFPPPSRARISGPPANGVPRNSNRKSWEGGGSGSTGNTGAPTAPQTLASNSRISRMSQFLPARLSHPLGKTSGDSIHTSTSKRFIVSMGNTVELEGSEKVVKTYTLSTFIPLYVNSPWFSVMSSLLVLSYAVFIAIETDMIAQDPGIDYLALKVFHYVYNIAFACELALRIWVEGWREVFCGKDSIWNRLDLFLVCSAIAETIAENAFRKKKSGAGGLMRAVRICRVIRTLRLVRTFRQFHEFQKMAYALASSLKTLACSLILLAFVMFFFAVHLTQSAADVEQREKIEDLNLRYGDLLSTTYTLFLSVSNGISWDLAYMPLHHLHLRASLAFLIYIVVTMFGLLNVVTSILVESVIRSAQHYKDLIVQDKEMEKQIAVSHVKELFKQLDVDSSGLVSIDDLEQFLREPGLRKYVEALDINAADTRLLFRLLDSDNSDTVSLEEFCEGCLRLKGNAKSIDVHTLIFQVRNFLTKWGEFTGFVEESFNKVHSRESLVDVINAGKVRLAPARQTDGTRST